ncbi:MAG: hypothetical protein RBS56_05005 [Candidatus Gracilibacteria bacterium]|jgi:hypothetical protein|nr:hypothetical protein [Candidatus Gracilibacteria bacterium]
METPKNYTEQILESDSSPKENEEKKESPKSKLSEATKERVKIEREIDRALKSYEKALSGNFNLKTPENNEDVKALNLFKQVQILRAKLVGAKMEKLEQLVLDFNALNGRVAEFLSEENNPIEKKRIDVAFNRTNLQPEPQDDLGLTEGTKARDPEKLSDLDYLTLEDESAKNPNVVDELTDTKVDRSLEFKQAEEVQKLQDLETQKQNQVTEKLAIINSDNEPENAPRLLRQLWELSHNKMGKIASIEPHTDNASLVFEYKNGTKKIVPPSAIDKFAGRSFDRFEKKYLSKVEDFEEKVTELDFEEDLGGRADTSEITPEESKLETEPKKDDYSKLDEKSGTDVLKGKGVFKV